ncbi:hypothetical protein PXH59_19890 (plasmid) [Xenorhabdus sp. SF857]|uniref:hypothetical protein n=1 Tax=Xenorhabdus bakwenae TaxID=3026967 RepID=UPI0025581190|nr:hypothetical protein [Xenorhabdus sp. SF857]WFQ81612.1 hypothetical protein PXH59_19890 [Xenorhabdus sp. SF857]
MKDIDYVKLLEMDVCPVCGEKDCILKIPKAVHPKKVMHGVVEAYCKNDMLKLKKIIIQRFSPFNRMFNHKFVYALENDTSMSSIGLLKHYREYSGEEISLSRIGVDGRIRTLMNKEGAFKKPSGTSIHSRFLSQIKNGERVSFSNAYDFGTESAHPNDPLWAIGSAIVSGRLSDIEVKERGNGYNLFGVVNYKLYDKFTDPVDIFNWFEKDWNPLGSPFEIKGEWHQPISIDIDKNIYENKIKQLLNK